VIYDESDEEQESEEEEVSFIPEGLVPKASNNNKPDDAKK
jgi:hypothetical protein